MQTPAESNLHYQTVASAITFLSEHQLEQPGLKQLASHVGMSESHLQRVFSEWAGVSPKQFLQFLTKQDAKRRLQQHSVLDAALDSGLSGSSRLHDLLVQTESVTPGEYRKLGDGLTLSYGVHPTQFGHCLVAATPRGVCKLAFFDDQDQKLGLVKELQTEWPEAVLVADQNATAVYVDRIFAQSNSQQNQPLRVLLKGSPFQIQVWEALLSIPDGQLCSYQQLAESINKPTASRAVASAVASNRVGYLIPCHRVIRSTGALNNYRWGEQRKAAIIGWEAAATQTA
jgi:AraC family transcriptional regulator of adaptative response/methylated-DNA-[protein]-cysteine methyltransferase